MTLSGGIVRRIVLATVLCGIIGFFSARGVLRLMTRTGIGLFQEPLAEYVYRTYEKARCESDPSVWSMALKHGARSFAYDAESLASQNPVAPPLDRPLLARARVSPTHIAIESRALNLTSSGTLVFRAADHGPCAIIQTTWESRSVGNELVSMLPLGALFAAVAAAVVGMFVLVRPLERIETRRVELQRHLADVSHDLKTPISSLHLALEQAIESNGDPELQPLLSAAMNDAVYLAALTTNLRIASEIQEGWEPGASKVGVDLTDVVDRVVTRARFFAKQRGLTLEVAVPDTETRAGCDPLAAEQAVSNVVLNALIHGKPGGHVAVVLEVSPGAFTLTVADDGSGVPPTELPRLGERTFRSDAARQRDPRGSGLGLAITNEVCTRCGWALSFDRERPHGLRVMIRGACPSRADRAEGYEGEV